MELTLADATERREAQALVERDGARLRVRDHTDAPDGVALRQRHTQDVGEEAESNAPPLRPPIHAEPRQPQDRQRVRGEALARGGEAVPLDAPASDGREPDQPPGDHRYVRRGEVQAELVLAGIVVEEPVQGRIAALDGRAIVSPVEEEDLNVSAVGLTPYR